MTHSPIATLEDFLAHALAIESEAAERYREFTAWFDERGESVLAGLCRNLARFEQEHLEELAEMASDLAIPDIPRDGYRWVDGVAPETVPREMLFLMNSSRQLLGIALEAELRAVAFFRWVAESSPDAEVARLATGMIADEEDHAGWVARALEYLPEEGAVEVPGLKPSVGAEPFPTA